MTYRIRKPKKTRRSRKLKRAGKYTAAALATAAAVAVSAFINSKTGGGAYPGMSGVSGNDLGIQSINPNR